MRALFVLHESKFIYGANRSITGLLQNVDYDYDFMICQSFTNRIDEGELREKFGKHLKKIYIVWMPRYRCQIYDKLGLYSECSHVANNIMALLYANKRKRIIREGQYDYIHLNSIVLYPMIESSDKYIMHVREALNPKYKAIKYVKRKMRKASGIIYIDKATKRIAEQEIINKRNVVINNPFDMTGVQDVDYEESLKKYGLSNQNTIFAMLGQIGEIKGSKLVLRAFMQHSNANSRLLIVGNDSHEYAKECRKIAENDKRIIFCGELKDTGGIYRISDYIIRGESQFCIGRTTYEGLFSGAGVIVPGYHDDLKGMPNRQEFENSVHLYKPQDQDALTEVIEECSMHKQTGRTFRSNLPEYMKKYYSFINKIVRNEEVG